MGLATAAAQRSHPPAALATSHVPNSASAGAELESLAAAPGHGMAIALQGWPQ